MNCNKKKAPKIKLKRMDDCFKLRQVEMRKNDKKTPLLAIKEINVERTKWQILI